MSDTTLDLLSRLARVVGAMALDTQWHDQMFTLVADIEARLSSQTAEPASNHRPSGILHPDVIACLLEGHDWPDPDERWKACRRCGRWEQDGKHGYDGDYQ